MNTKLFVGNLSFNTTKNDLQDARGAHGVVTEAIKRRPGAEFGSTFSLAV